MPDAAGLTSAWLLGVSLGLTACTVTCLPYMGTWMMARGREAVWMDTSAFLAGRISAYAGLGLVAGLAGQGLTMWLSGGTGHIALGMASLAAGIWLWRGSARHRCGISRLGAVSPMAMGFSLSLTPCAPLASLLAFAAQSGSAASGMGYGLAFGLGAAVTPLLVLLPALGWLGQRLGEGKATLGLWLRRAGAGVLIILGIYRIGMGL